MELVTIADVVERLNDNSGGVGENRDQRQVILAVLDALRDVSRLRDWTYYRQHARLATVAPYNTGTIVYDHSGGTYPRMVTLTGGSWPEWAERGVLAIGTARYAVDEWKSTSVVTMSANSNPGGDLATSAFALFQDTYPLPQDALSVSSLYSHARRHYLPYTPAAKLDEISADRYSEPVSFTIMGSPDYLGEMSLRFGPPPSGVETWDLVYQRRPAVIRTRAYSLGTISATSGSSDIVGVSTEWTSEMVGTMLRFGTGNGIPTDVSGPNPYTLQRIVTAVSGPTSLTVDAPVDRTFAGVRYMMSDPLDIHVPTMLTAIVRLAELNDPRRTDAKDRQWRLARYQEAIVQAIEADSMYRGSREVSAGVPGRGWNMAC